MIEDYQKARKAGLKTYHRAISSGHYPYLHALDEMVDTPRLAEYPVGLLEIPLSMIAGTKTKGRQGAFARDFMPLLDADTEFARKWSSLYDSQIEEGIRDPIKVYEYMHLFYVQEGNKRVSVSSFVGSVNILASITRLLPEKSDSTDYKVYQEFLTFYQSAPIYEISYTLPGSYQKTAEILGEDFGHPWPEDVVRKLKGGYQSFEKVYLKEAGDKISIRPGDAFLTYLTVYGLDDITTLSDDDLSRRIKKIWNELILQGEDDRIALIESPSLDKEKSAGSNILSQIFPTTSSYSKKDPLRAVFCYERPAETSSWIYGHELGRNYVEDHFNGVVTTKKYDDCTDSLMLRKNIDEAAEEGADLIFTISPKLMEETLRCALHYPKIRFLNCSINMSHSAVRTYYGRMFEAKALMGVLAASLAEDHRIGYLADYPIYGSVAEINAFAIGAAMMDPYVQVFLSWNAVKDNKWEEVMRENEVSIISGPDFIRPESASRMYGLFQIRGEEVKNLAAPVWNWGKYYELIIRSILEGTYDDDVPKAQALNYWWGMSAGVIDVILSDRLPYYSHKLIQNLKKATILDALGPFTGELRSQTGIVKGADSPPLTGDEIITMNWLNDNVVGSLPKMEDLTEEAKKTVKVSGILKEKL